MSSLPAKITVYIILLFVSSLARGEIYLNALGGSSSYPGFSDGATSFELGAGYRFNDHLAVEFSWLNFGDVDFGFRRPQHEILRVEATGPSLIGLLPLSENFEVFWKLGVYAWKIDSTSLTASAAFRSKSQGTDTDFLIGYGANWWITNNLAMRIQYQELDVQGDNISNASAGFTYAF